MKYKIVILNVGGRRHEMLWEKINSLPNTRLGRLQGCQNNRDLLSLCDDYDLKWNEYFFDRNPEPFDCILEFYKTGKIHVLFNYCVFSFAEELNYWGISDLFISSCCVDKYYCRKEKLEQEIENEEHLRNVSKINKFGNGKWAKLHETLWQYVEKPQTSMIARIFSVTSILFILLSTLTLILNTIPELQLKENISAKDNITKTWKDKVIVKDNLHLEILETICVSWFTLEYIIRLLFSPSTLEFLKNPLNVIDLLSILPFYISLLIVELHRWTSGSLLSIGRLIQSFRILRIFRIFKLARHSTGLQSLGYTLKGSYKELGMLVMFIALGVMVFSCLIYFAEKEQNGEQFRSIPAAFWWATITMTTVGYGDVVPKTPFGKLIGALCCLCGVLVVALPIPIIVNNFSNFYQEQLRKEALEKARRGCCIISAFSSSQIRQRFHMRNSPKFSVPSIYRCTSFGTRLWGFRLRLPNKKEQQLPKK